MARLAVVLLALFAHMDRTCTVARAAHACSVAAAKGGRIGRPTGVDPDELAYAVHLREGGHTIADTVAGDRHRAHQLVPAPAAAAAGAAHGRAGRPA